MSRHPGLKRLRELRGIVTATACTALALVGASLLPVWAGTAGPSAQSAPPATPQRQLGVESVGAEQRADLVIGNGAYQTGRLRNPANDARGLASIDAPSGTLIACAAAPGKVAQDGTTTRGACDRRLGAGPIPRSRA